MSMDEKMTMLRALIGDNDDQNAEARLSAYLQAAGREIVAWRGNGMAGTVYEVPAEFEMTQIYAVIAGYGISGAEGQTQHSENGINRTFKYPDMIDYIRAHVIPMAVVL